MSAMGINTSVAARGFHYDRTKRNQTIDAARSRLSRFLHDIRRVGRNVGAPVADVDGDDRNASVSARPLPQLGDRLCQLLDRRDAAAHQKHADRRRRLLRRAPRVLNGQFVDMRHDLRGNALAAIPRKQLLRPGREVEVEPSRGKLLDLPHLRPRAPGGTDSSVALRTKSSRSLRSDANRGGGVRQRSAVPRAWQDRG